MSNPRFAIGIDLGTTNSSLAYLPLTGEGESEILAIPQWQTLTTTSDSPTLPSFLYLPDAVTAARLDSGESSWIVGLLARNQAGNSPGQVAQSAKSWLGHHSADREAPFLPWGSEALTPEQKISPLKASGLILNHLKNAWNLKFAGAGEDYRFDAQRITITVPASFDAAAQKLTLRAADLAGYPPDVTLLEEPQAAFYRWLEQQGTTGDWSEALTGAVAGTLHVLVVDIGGGTSDFSLFAVRPKEKSPLPGIERIAVSDHILLGGDNIDLALAHLVETRLGGGDVELSATQWEFLVARCRDLKERVLASPSSGSGPFPMSIPGRGSGLIGATLGATVTREELEGLLVDGFFPSCKAGERPHEAPGALKEWGLPYAHDSAMTRHLAGFLRDAPRVNAVLFNGGSLDPEFLRRRILDEMERWQDGIRPRELTNPEPMLAVARGAARFGYLGQRREERIVAGAARSIFLEVSAGEGKGPPSLVCILPRGVGPDDKQRISEPALRLKVNQRVRFQAYYSTKGRWTPGEVADDDPEQFHRLPPLESEIRLDQTAAGRQPAIPEGETLPVTLEAEINELGILMVAIVSADPAITACWPLEFNLRPVERSGARKSSGAAEAPPLAVDEATLQRGAEFIRSFYGQPLGKKNKPSPRRCLSGLEEILGQTRGEWNLTLVRTLWRYLEASSSQRRLSVEHEESWIINAGFLLRPGFGAPLDEDRIDALWRLHTHGPCFPGKRIKIQLQVLWRRVAGGLSRERQEQLITGELQAIRQTKNLSPESIRLAGALERISIPLKIELVETLIARARERINGGQDASVHFAALGSLLNRAPLYAGPETVLSPQWVERAFTAFSVLDWSPPAPMEMRNLFLMAARLVDNRSVDLDKALRKKIANKLEKAGAPPAKCQRLLQFVPLGETDRSSLYGEALPRGLILQ